LWCCVVERCVCRCCFDGSRMQQAVSSVCYHDAEEGVYGVQGSATMMNGPYTPEVLEQLSGAGTILVPCTYNGRATCIWYVQARPCAYLNWCWLLQQVLITSFLHCTMCEPEALVR
jgi:hypothetical protein